MSCAAELAGEGGSPPDNTLMTITELQPTHQLPLVSVIVPTYNYGHLIGQTLESLQAQTYQHWECIVVDDGSTDNTGDIVAGFSQRDERIKYLRQKNHGQAAAINVGIKASVGEYIQSLDADDLIEEHKLERQIEYLERHPEIDIVYGNVRYFKTENMNEQLYSMKKEDAPWMPESSGLGEDILPILIRGNIMAINSALIRRSVIADVGLFDEQIPIIQDWDYWIRCAAKGKSFQYANLDGTLALVRSHSASSSKNKQGVIAALLLMRKKIAASFTDADILKINRDMTAQVEALSGIEKVASGEVADGARHLFRAGLMDGRLTWKWRLKCVFCALISPFTPGEQFREIASFSTTQLIKRKLPTLRKLC